MLYGKDSTGKGLTKMSRKISGNKKASLNYFSDWAEFFFLVLLFIGLIFGIMSPSAVITYLVAFFSGMMAGRLFYERKNKGRAPYLLIIIGFIMGYVIGTFHGDRKISFLLFLFGAALSYYLFDKKIIKDTFENIWKLNVDSNIYLLDFKEKIIIDAGPKNYKDTVKEELGKVTDLDKINNVIFTHLHYDHIGNFDLFPNAKFYASEEEIEYLKKHKIFAIGDPLLAAKFNVELFPLKELEGFDIIKTPGHTKGSFCLLYKKEKILFSGDTLFFNGFGRIDFPGSAPEKMKASLDLLGKIDYKTLAPGHDY